MEDLSAPIPEEKTSKLGVKWRDSWHGLCARRAPTMKRWSLDARNGDHTSHLAGPSKEQEIARSMHAVKGNLATLFGRDSRSICAWISASGCSRLVRNRLLRLP
jgi:hypothetical protein